MTSIAREPQASVLPARRRETILEILLPAETSFEVSLSGLGRRRLRGSLLLVELCTEGLELFLLLPQVSAEEGGGG